MPYEEIPKLYCKASFYLLTSKWESFGVDTVLSNWDTYSLKCIEY